MAVLKGRTFGTALSDDADASGALFYSAYLLKVIRVLGEI